MENSKARFMSLSLTEKIAGISAAVMILAYILAKAWQAGGWFPTCAIIGAAGVLILVGAGMLGQQIMDPALRPKVLSALSVLPMLGLVIDMTRTSFWYALLFAGTFAMAYAAALSTGRVKTS